MNVMKLDSQPSSSTFAQIVDRLRTKSEAELKVLYIQFFKNDLNEEWAAIMQSSDFKNATEKDIIKAIKKKRYSSIV